MRAFIDPPASISPLTSTFPYPLFNKLLYIGQAVAPKTAQQEADCVFEKLSKHDAQGNTPIHCAWPAQSVQLARAFASFDKEFGIIIATDLVKKLLLLANKQDALPLDKLLDNGNTQERNAQINAFLSTLRQNLGSQDKFKAYVTEGIAAFLPPDFTIRLSAYEPDLEQPKGARPKHGARIEP